MLFLLLYFVPYLFFTATCTSLLLHKTSLKPWEIIASSIINRYSKSIHDTQIICENTCASDEFLKLSQLPIQLSHFRLHEDSILFVLPQSQLFVSSVLDSASNFTKSKYVIFLDCGECATVAWILEQCWQHMLLNVVVISIQNGSSPIYSYYPFKKGKCFDPRPVFIDCYTDTNTFLLNAELFPKRKVWNLLNCTLKISTFELNPAIYFDKLEMRGWLSPIFKSVAHVMNFHPEFIHMEGKEWTGGVSGPKKTGIRGDVFTGNAHLGFSLLQPIDFNYLDYDSLALTGCVTWCLPATFKQKSIWWPIIGEFTPIVWFILFLSAMSMVASDYLTRGNDRVRSNGPNNHIVVSRKRVPSTTSTSTQLSRVHDASTIDEPRAWSEKPRAGQTNVCRTRVRAKDLMYMPVVAALLQGPQRMPRHPSASFRVLWICWLISSLVLSTAYLSTLKSLRTAPYIEYLVKNLDDLVEAGFEAWYERGLADMMDDAIETNPALGRLKSKSFLYPSDMTSTMITRFQYKNITSLMMDKQCHMVSALYGGKLDLYPVPEACMQVTSLHCFVMRKKSIFTEAVSTLMGRMTQAGIIQKSLSSGMSLSRSADIKQRPITLKNMYPALLVVVSGLTVSVIVFLVERLYNFFLGF